MYRRVRIDRSIVRIARDTSRTRLRSAPTFGLTHAFPITQDLSTSPLFDLLFPLVFSRRTRCRRYHEAAELTLHPVAIYAASLQLKFTILPHVNLHLSSALRPLTKWATRLQDSQRELNLTSVSAASRWVISFAGSSRARRNDWPDHIAVKSADPFASDATHSGAEKPAASGKSDLFVFCPACTRIVSLVE
jgi:hypothetical protein